MTVPIIMDASVFKASEIHAKTTHFQCESGALLKMSENKIAVPIPTTNTEKIAKENRNGGGVKAVA